MTFWEWLNHWMTIPELYRTPLDNWAMTCWILLLIVLPIIAICLLLWFVYWLNNEIDSRKADRKRKGEW